jgi:4-hydroxybenzoate polyprenyltransferase
MVAAVRGLRAVRVYLDMIKIEHSIFALPFAMIGMMEGSMAVSRTPWPGWPAFGWIVVAMVSCRSAAMAFNRIADRKIDALNPRTRMRALPAGLLRLSQVNAMFLVSCALFVLAAWSLNPLAFALSPVALGVTLLYSLTKRFTPLCHFVLGLSLGIAPAAAWIGITGFLDPKVLWLTAAVTFWTAGFDIIYALQDEEFDRQQGLRSLPQTLGKSRALTVSRVSHAVSVGCLLAGVAALQGSALFYVGVGLAAALLVYEQSLVRPNDLSRVNVAFFTLNGFVSLGLFAFALADVLFRSAGP